MNGSAYLRCNEVNIVCIQRQTQPVIPRQGERENMRAGGEFWLHNARPGGRRRHLQATVRARLFFFLQVLLWGPGHDDRMCGRPRLSQRLPAQGCGHFGTVLVHATWTGISRDSRVSRLVMATSWGLLLEHLQFS
jgi:hypothetical protein